MIFDQVYSVRIHNLLRRLAQGADLLRQPPAQAESRADLREKVPVAAGGVVFTTIQKFFPEERG